MQREDRVPRSAGMLIHCRRMACAPSPPSVPRSSRHGTWTDQLEWLDCQVRAHVRTMVTAAADCPVQHRRHLPRRIRRGTSPENLVASTAVRTRTVWRRLVVHEVHRPGNHCVQPGLPPFPELLTFHFGDTLCEPSRWPVLSSFTGHPLRHQHVYPAIAVTHRLGNLDPGRRGRGPDGGSDRSRMTAAPGWPGTCPPDWVFQVPRSSSTTSAAGRAS